MTTLLRDARFGLRLLRRNPGFTAVAVITLALGISATTAIFSVVYGTFFAPLPYRQADRLVMLWQQDDGERESVSTANFVEWRRRATVFSDLNAWGGRSVNVATEDRPENLLAGTATPGFPRDDGLRVPAGAGPDVHRGGRRRRSRQSRRPHVPGLAGPLCRRPRHPWATGAARRRAVYRRWRAGGRSRRSPAEQAVAAAGLYGRATGRRQQLAQRDGPPERRRLHRRSQCEHGRPWRDHRARAPVARTRAKRQRRALPQQLRPRLDQTGAVAAVGRRGVPAADRLRQRRQPAAGARQRAPARAGRADLDGRHPRRHRQAAAGREPGRLARRRRPRCACVGGAPGRHRRADASVHVAVGNRDRAERAGARVCARRLCPGRHRGRLRAGLAGLAREPERDDEGGRPIGEWRASWVEACAGGRRVRARLDAALRRRDGGACAGRHDERRPRLPPRACPHLRAAGVARAIDHSGGDRDLLSPAPGWRDGAARRALRVAVDRHARVGRPLRPGLRDRRPPPRRPRTAARGGREHGDPGVLRDVRHQHASWPRVHRTRSSRQRAGGDRQRGVREALPARGRSARTAPAHATVS